MIIYLTESQAFDIETDAARLYSITYELGHDDAFDASQELIDKKLSSYSFDQEGCNEVIRIIERDYKNALKTKEANLLNAEKFKDELQKRYSTLTFHVKAYT